MDALKGMFPVDPGVLERKINENWAAWDADGNGTLGKTSKIHHGQKQHFLPRLYSNQALAPRYRVNKKRGLAPIVLDGERG